MNNEVMKNLIKRCLDINKDFTFVNNVLRFEDDEKIENNN